VSMSSRTDDAGEPYVSHFSIPTKPLLNNSHS
jgi:hypothetical protein